MAQDVADSKAAAGMGRSGRDGAVEDQPQHRPGHLPQPGRLGRGLKRDTYAVIWPVHAGAQRMQTRKELNVPADWRAEMTDN